MSAHFYRGWTPTVLLATAVLLGALTIGCTPSSPKTGEGSGSSLVMHADESTFDQTVLGAPGTVLVDFYADWCGPCQRLAPTLEEMARENPSLRIVKVNVDQSSNLAARFKINSIPHLIVFRNGQMVNQTRGLQSKSQLLAMVGQ